MHDTTPLIPCARDLLAGLPAKERHDLRSAILCLRISSELLCEGSSELSEQQKQELASEMRAAAKLLEAALVAPQSHEKARS